MDKVNFLGQNKFPVSTNTFDIMQNATILASQLAFIGGVTYILSGCTESVVDGKIMVSDGIIVINGEPLPFIGGEKQDYIAIDEVNKRLGFGGVQYPEAYKFRSAGFASNGILWSSVKRLLSNLELQDKVDSFQANPIGCTIGWPGLIDKIPENYMLCDRRTLSIESYPELYKVLGTIYGGDGVTSFRLPPSGGLFTVGYSEQVGDYNEQGKTGGEEKHQLTEDELPKTNLANDNRYNKLSARAADIDDVSTPTGTDAINADREYNIGHMNPESWELATIRIFGKDQPHENRPPYIVEAKIIKVK